MRVKTFKGPNMTAVLAQVKLDLGEDAVILSNKTVPGENGKKVCEVMAAVDRPQQPEAAPAAERETPDILAGLLDGQAPDWAREWAEIKGHLMSLMRPQMNTGLLSPRQKLALDHLEREGVSNDALMTIYNQLKSSVDGRVLPVLRRMVSAKPFSTSSFPQKVQAFAGPHGSGKTTTLLRLALKDKKDNPKARICLAGADGSQGKGRLVLRHYADLSGLGFREASTIQDVAALMGDRQTFDRIYLDLPGLAPGENLAGALEQLGLGGDDFACHLVLSPHYAPAQLAEFIRRYGAPELRSIVWTKLDEACMYGAVVNAAAAGGLPVSALSYGPGLKNSLAPAEEEQLMRLVFQRRLPDAPDATRSCTGKSKRTDQP